MPLTPLCFHIVYLQLFAMLLCGKCGQNIHNV